MSPRAIIPVSGRHSDRGDGDVVLGIVGVRRIGQGDDVAADHLEHADDPEHSRVVIIDTVDIEHHLAGEVIEGVGVQLQKLGVGLELLYHVDHCGCDLRSCYLHPHASPPSLPWSSSNIPGRSASAAFSMIDRVSS